VGLEDAVVLLKPYLGDAGRLTIGDVHYVVRDGAAVPVAETEFARDPAFAYAESDLRRWAAARPGVEGRPIASISLDLIRQGGPEAVATALRSLPPRAICVVNAADDRDAEVVAAAGIDAGRTRPIIARTAAGYVRARAGQARRADLAAAELGVPAGPGLVVVGSHVPMTTRQLDRLLADPPIAVELIEMPAAAAATARGARRIRNDATARVTAALAAGVTPVIATSRDLLGGGPGDPTGLALAGRVSRMLVGVVADLPRRPAWVLAKGGITSSDVATRGLAAASATVMGQLLPGVPVWRARPPGRRPIVLVVFPGNVGGEDALRTAVGLLAEAGRVRPPPAG
jgi:uncharacterized protein YgbK (DUF1537 family)